MMVTLAIKDLVKNGKNQTKHYPAGIYLFKANFEDAGITSKTRGKTIYG